MSITAVVVTWNRCELLRECLDGVLAQKPAPERVIVVDNASDDATPELLAASPYAERVEVIRTHENLGGAGLQCAVPDVTPIPNPVTGSTDALPRWAQIDFQGWGKVSPIGVQIDCNGVKPVLPSFQICGQWRVRFLDWIDIEQQTCRKVWDPFNAGAQPNDGGMGAGG